MPGPRFEQVAPLVDFPTLEARIRRLWKERDVFHRSLAKREGRPRFVFYEGPPTANGLPHNGHALTRVMKDVFPRYKTMRGFFVPRKAGWDTHGLPVETEVEKELRISGKAAIEAYGVERFVRRCLESVFRYTEEWERFSEALAFWVDTEDAYVTYHQSYVESVWWALARLHQQGLLYRGHKVVWWWAQGGTALSAAEVGQGYRTVDDPSVYVLFPLIDKPGDFLVVWTTTPWTLSANTFVAVKPDEAYVVVRDGNRRLIVATKLLRTLEEKIGRSLAEEEHIHGDLLLNKRYEPPFNWFADCAGAPDIWRVHEADFLEFNIGTGLVHVAPAFGEDDFNLLRFRQQFHPDIPLLNPVRPDGTFDPAVASSEYGGRWVKDCDKDLIRDLRNRGLLLHHETYRHEYPFCERSENDPLIQYARPAWYIRTTDKVQEALRNNAGVNWLPEHIKEGRFGDFLRNNVDWALSRERYWGTPLNVWINDQSGAIEMPTSAAEIRERNPDAFAGFEDARAADPTLSPHLMLHKPWIDQVTWSKPGETGVYRRVPEVIDVWFDSGCMPFAQWGHPHRGEAEFQQNYPADFISEAIDQTRGWFNSLLWVSTLLFPDAPDPKPYRTCMVLGHICDREGKKESKSKGNYTPPEVILSRVRLEFAAVRAEGADAPAPGRAWIAREDYEGLDLAGESHRVRAWRGGDEAGAVELELSPAKLPRRLVVLSEPDRGALGVEFAPHGHRTLPREVTDLAPTQKVWLHDPAGSAPGADAFRWFFFASNPPWSNTRLSLAAVRALQRELPLKLRNVFSFFTIYANVDGFDPADAACKAGRRPPRERALLDRWILSELALTTQRTVEWMDAFRVYEASGVLTRFVEALSNWWVRRSRERFWAPGLEQDKLDAHWTLFECLVTSAKLVAPFLPFAAEEIWQNLVRRPWPNAPDESVHLCDYPEADADAIDLALSRAMGVVRELVSLGLQVRTAEKLRVRQPLAAAEIVLAEPELAAALAEHLELVREELNVRAVHWVPKADEYVRYVVKPNFRALGPRAGKHMPALKAALAASDGAALLRQLESDGRVDLDVAGERFALTPEELQVTLEARPGFAAASGAAGVVVLRTALSPELVEEGLFREVLNRVQSFRKDLDLEYTGRIRLTLDGSPALLAAVRPRVEELCRETLALEARVGVPPAPGAEQRELRVDGEPLVLGLERA